MELKVIKGSLENFIRWLTEENRLTPKFLLFIFFLIGIPIIFAFTDNEIIKLSYIFLIILYMIVINLYIIIKRKRIINIIIVAFIIIFIFLSLHKMFKDLVIIQKISIPVKFQKENEGYTNIVIINHIFDEINRINLIIGKNKQHVLIEENKKDKQETVSLEYSLKNGDKKSSVSLQISDILINFQEFRLTADEFSEYIKTRGYFKIYQLSKTNEILLL